MNEGERVLQQLADDILTLDSIIDNRECIQNVFGLVDGDHSVVPLVEENPDWGYVRMYTVCKKDGTDYEPDTITGFQNSIDRHLKDKGVTFSIKRDGTFSHSNRVLEAKRKHLKAEGKGNKSRKAEPLSCVEIQNLQEQGLIGTGNPEQLLYTVWLNNGVYFGLRGRQDHVNLLWGDIKLKKTSEGREYLEFHERRTKTRSGAKSTDIRKVTPKMFEKKDNPYCPVTAYKAYRDHRPEGQLNPESRFYLQDIKSPRSNKTDTQTAVTKVVLVGVSVEEADKELLIDNDSIILVQCKQVLATAVSNNGPSTL